MRVGALKILEMTAKGTRIDITLMSVYKIKYIIIIITR